MSSNEFDTSRDVKTGLGGAALLAGSIGIGQLPYDSVDSIYQPVAHVVDTALTVGGVAGGLLVAGSVAHGFYGNSRTAHRRRVFHAPGWANRHSFADHLGAKAIRRAGQQTRPSLANRADRRAAKATNSDFGQFLGKAVTGFRPARGSEVFADFQKSLLFVAPPGAGKTALMLHSLMDAPGSVLATSTKPDIYTLTSELRAELGPVYLFNPQNVGGLLSTFGWDPLIGCEHYQVAQDRATALVKGTRAITAMQEASWGEKCVEIMSKYLMAARLWGQDLRAVAYWLAHPDDETAVRILQQFPSHVPDGWAASLEAEMRSSADRMKGSIWSLARGSVSFMSNPVIAQACTKGAGESFNVKEFALSRGTLYLLGDSSDETIAPLLAALTDYVYRDFKALAQVQPGERLDPPFGFFLDEVTKITPVPLADWAADIRSHGGYITAITQSFAQIEDRWGKEGLAAIKGLFSKVILPGIQNLQDLEELSKLVGTREVDAVSEGETDSASGRSKSRNRSKRKELILPPEDIRMLPPMHALIMINESKAVVTKFKHGQIRAKKMTEGLRAAKAKARPDDPGTVNAQVTA
ncbi:type IV secretory system conjugative DNA transfer family protein [Amycolatopsis sp. NBC_01480]|uniref:type IV secretory system conjugative DNA transfer family protein n=1 Tax=Amycolatopsis sp. NBC_01480 TaxID=2903562 RepID=UPI002E2A9FD4|nr:type IV secretory system conjugative DNA transfer family protein [Amycolatopsis sp. NBC_01480]